MSREAAPGAAPRRSAPGEAAPGESAEGENGSPIGRSQARRRSSLTLLRRLRCCLIPRSILRSLGSSPVTAITVLRSGWGYLCLAWSRWKSRPVRLACNPEPLLATLPVPYRLQERRIHDFSDATP